MPETFKLSITDIVPRLKSNSRASFLIHYYPPRILPAPWSENVNFIIWRAELFPGIKKTASREAVLNIAEACFIVVFRKTGKLAEVSGASRKHISTRYVSVTFGRTFPGHPRTGEHLNKSCSAGVTSGGALVSHHAPQTKINEPHILFMPRFTRVSLHSDSVLRIPHYQHSDILISQFTARYLNTAKKSWCLTHSGVRKVYRGT